MGQGLCVRACVCVCVSVCVCVCETRRGVVKEEVAGIARPVGVRLRGRKVLGDEKPLPHPGHPGKATHLNYSNTRNPPWFQVSHLCVPKAGCSRAKEAYSRGTPPGAEGLPHRGAPLPPADPPSQGCSFPPAGSSLTEAPPSPQQDAPSQGCSPSPSRMLPHRGALFPQQDPPLQRHSLPPSRMLPHRGAPVPL